MEPAVSPTHPRIMVAMSGGVDSSVAALLLREQGADLVGMTMCLGVADAPGTHPTCCGPEAVRDARRVCDQLDIPHYVMDYAELLQKHVIDRFVDEYRHGRTPNPCILCNRYLKFGSLLQKARGMGYDAVATGHYARIVQEADGWSLHTGHDPDKDQSYFLYGIRRDALPLIRLPVGGFDKGAIRSRAREAGLVVANKEESQDICFIPGGDYRDFLASRVENTPGQFVAVDGTVLGTHRGIANYTIGQRKGLGVAAGRPLYVVAVRPDTNTVVLGDREDLACRTLTARQLNLLCDSLPDRAAAMIRYSHPAQPCSLHLEGDRLEITFDEPQEAVTPGQSVVVYEGDRVLGGGIIEGRG